MRLSLVIGTLGRTTVLERLLGSLAAQTHRDFELIVVDQNTDNRLIPILQAYDRVLHINRVQSPPGVSRARNLGLQFVSGDVVCFPDDDCWFGPDALSKVAEHLSSHPEWAGLVGDSVDEAGRLTLPWRDREGDLTLPMSWRRSIAYAIFLRTRVIQAIGGFDESLGLGSGSPWGSGEDNDLVLRAIKRGFRVHYQPSLEIYHPRLYPSFDEAGRKKRHNYALGDGKLLQLHPMPAWWKSLFFVIPASRAILGIIRLNTKEAYAHYLTLTGRLKGYLSVNNSKEANIPFPLRDSLVEPQLSSASAKASSAAGGR